MVAALHGSSPRRLCSTLDGPEHSPRRRLPPLPPSSREVGGHKTACFTLVWRLTPSVVLAGARSAHYSIAAVSAKPARSGGKQSALKVYLTVPARIRRIRCSAKGYLGGQPARPHRLRQSIGSATSHQTSVHRRGHARCLCPHKESRLGLCRSRRHSPVVGKVWRHFRRLPYCATGGATCTLGHSTPLCWRPHGPRRQPASR